MTIVPRVAAAVQWVLSEMAEQAAKVSQTVRRRRKFTGSSLVSTLVLGWLKQPDATPDDLAKTAAELGVDVTPQAVKKRFTMRLVECLKGVFAQAATTAIAGEPRSIPLLAKFTAVRIGDSSSITLPEEWADEFPGCGGVSGSGKAAVKLQVEWDQWNGQLKVVLEPGATATPKAR